MKKYLAEFIGTLVLVLFGCGSAVAANALQYANGFYYPLAFTSLLISFGFGLSIVAMAYSVGNISGCHLNPAVSLAMLITGRMSIADFLGYIAAQLFGATAGAGLLWLIIGTNTSLGTNGYDEASALGINAPRAFVLETVLTFVFVFVILEVTSKEEFTHIAGVVIGLTLTLVHLLGVPFTGTSVNPARSFGPAILSPLNSAALKQLWLFIVAPLVGGAIAALVFRCFHSQPNESKRFK